MKEEQGARECMNGTQTCTESGAELTRPRSGPVRYELVDKDGRRVATNVSAHALAITAKHFWPDQEQDEERSGKGWDIQAVGSDLKTS